MSIATRIIIKALNSRLSCLSKVSVRRLFDILGLSNYSSRPNFIWIQAINYILLGSTIFVFLWLSFAKTDEIIVIGGKLQPVGKVKHIRIPAGSYVQNIYIEDGQYVDQGQLLLTLHTDRLNDQISSLISGLENKNLQIIAMDRSLDILNSDLLSTSALNAENLTSFELTLQYEQVLLEKIQSLNKYGAIANTDYLRQLNKVSSIKRSIVESKIEAKLRLDKIKFQINQLELQQSGLHSEKISLESDLSVARRSLDQRLIRSPISGIAFDLKLTNKGYTSPEISSSSVLKIVPSSNLQAYVDIPSSKIGLIEIGHKVDISIDSYPASDFGTVPGKLVFIGPDSIALQSNNGFEGYRYQGVVELDKNYSFDNKESRIGFSSGMTLKANIKLRRVTYMQLLFSSLFERVGKIREY